MGEGKQRQEDGEGAGLSETGGACRCRVLEAAGEVVLGVGTSRVESSWHHNFNCRVDPRFRLRL